MLFDLEPLIFKALVSNQKIVDYLGKINGGFPNIGANRAPQGIFPLIEFHQIYGSDLVFGDDELVARQYGFQVGIYSLDDDFYLIENELDKEMRELGFTCYNDYKYSVDDSKVIHRFFSYTIRLNSEMHEQLKQKYEIGDD